eukprot:scaffold46095_cov70-Attheya_sp.AAC.10
MATSPPSDAIDFFPSIVQGAPNNTTQDPNVAVDTLLGTRVNRYRASKPTTTTMATVVANQQPTMEGCY